MNLVKFIPNLFTLANLACGVIGIKLVFDGDIENTAYLVFLAAIFDFLDGFLAKTLNAKSEIGKQLDSLADLVTFGVLPGFLYYFFIGVHAASELGVIAIIVPLASAYRLAKFNISNDQNDSFKGISTTAHGIFVATLLMIWLNPKTTLDNWILGSDTLVILSVFFSFLMVSNLSMMSMKFANYSFSDNWDRYLMLIGTVILVVIFGWSASIPAMLLYLSLSLIKHYTSINN